MIEFAEHVYPLAPPRQLELIGLWRSAWTRTDYDWLESMHGDYAGTLTIQSVIAYVDGVPAATASVLYAKDAPTTCVIANVVALPEHRGKGLGQQVAERAVAIGFAAGCDVAMLGSGRHNGNVYERCGFRRVAGSIMRRDASTATPDSFAAGQPAAIRPAQWGDLPGFVRLVAEPLGTVLLDYPRGLLSPAAIAPLRAVSAFTTVWEDVQRHAGAMLVLASPARRIFGFATLTPGPAPSRAATAIIDFALHDAYAAATDELLNRLLAEAEARSINTLDASIAAADTHKLAALEASGFRRVATLKASLLLRDGRADVILLRRQSDAPSDGSTT